MSTKLVFFGGSKGGVGKSTNAHLACLGAILCNQPAAYVLTDPDREIREKGRPYEVLDGREPKELANTRHVVFRDGVEYVTDKKIVIGMTLRQQRRLRNPIVVDFTVWEGRGLDNRRHASLLYFVVSLTTHCSFVRSEERRVG